jgi:hypothetical protein
MACNNKMMLGAIALGLGSLATAQSMTFDTPVTTGNSQAAGTWYTDRYAPAGFTAPVSFMGDNRLKQTISSADSETGRPGGFSAAFYNTQGRKYDLNPNTTSMSIDLYVAADWSTSGKRMAGFWGTALDNVNAVSAFPILEFTSGVGDADGSGARFRGWDNTTGTWISMGLPTGFAYDQFYTLKIDMAGSNFVYRVGDLALSTSNEGSSSIGNVILQGHNNAAGVNYDIYWDNLNAVPEPTSMAAVGLGVLALARRRRKKA